MVHSILHKFTWYWTAGGELVEQQPQRALARSQLQQTAFTFVSLQLGGGGNGCRIIWTEKHDIINWIRAVLKEKRGHSHLINIAFVLALGWASLIFSDTQKVFELTIQSVKCLLAQSPSAQLTSRHVTKWSNESVHCREEGCIGKYTLQGPREFPRAGILHPEAREIARGPNMKVEK